MLSLLKKAGCLPRSIINNKTALFFAKEAKPAKGDAKGGAPAPAAAVIEQPKLEQLVVKWIKPNHKPLSPSEIKILNEGFEDLSAQDKQILDQFAQKILDLPTAILYDVMKKGALGTSDMYYTSVEQISDVELPKAVKLLRKEV